jgi:hypothetical protein
MNDNASSVHMRDHVILDLALDVTDRRLADKTQPPNVWEAWTKLRAALLAGREITSAGLRESECGSGNARRSEGYMHPIDTSPPRQADEPVLRPM